TPSTPAQGTFSLTALAGSAQRYLMMRLTALAQEGDAKFVSRPRVITMENQLALLSNSEEFYVPVAGRDSADLFNVSVGMSFQVTPTLVGEPNKQSVKLYVQIADGVTTPQLVGSIPLVKRNQLSMEGIVMPGQSLVIGGYAVEESGQGVEKVPVLGDIPVLGALFRKTNDRSRRTERLFIITPRLLDLDRVADSQQTLPKPALIDPVSFVIPADVSAIPATDAASNEANQPSSSKPARGAKRPVRTPLNGAKP
ncbi:MAG: hypothetical protein ACRDAM_08535, partial [Casimicrobium sp.]